MKTFELKLVFCRCTVVFFTAIISVGVNALETITFYHTDHLNSVVATSDIDGEILLGQHYRPYGERIKNDDGDSANHQWYSGRYTDGDSGITYMHARHYDPQIGRFLSLDALDIRPGDSGSFNRYSYARNNPYGYVDPNGEDAVSINLFVAGVTFGRDSPITGVTAPEDKGYSGLLFGTMKFGMVGLGFTYDPSARVPIQQGNSPPGPFSCTSCKTTTTKWERTNIGTGLTALFLSWNPISYDQGTLINRYKYSELVDSNFVEGAGLNFNLFNFSTGFDTIEKESKGEASRGFGIDLGFEANYEFGTTIDTATFWDSFFAR